MKHRFFLLPLVFVLLATFASVEGWGQYSSGQANGMQVDTAASGDWRGTVVSAQGLRFQLVLHMTVYTNGPCEVYYDNVGQQQYNRRFSGCSNENGRFLLTIDSLAAEFDGMLTPQEGVISGTWRQGRTIAPVVFRKLQPVIYVQEPTSSHTNVERPYTVPNRKSGVMLEGTMVLPSGSGPFPLFVFVSDRGHQDRNATDESGHKPFLVMAHAFAQEGWASVRMDDSRSTMEEQVDDLVAVIDRIHGSSEIDKTKIVILGHGDGGLIATVAARQRPGMVSAIVTAGTASIDGRSLATGMVRASDELYGVDEDVISVASDLVGMWYDAAATPDTDGSTVRRIASVTDSVLAVHSELLAVYPAAIRLTKPDRLGYINDKLIPWLKVFIDLKAPERLLPTPVQTLVMLADRDVITPFEANRKGWRKISNRSTKVDILEFTGVNHGFQNCEDCTADEAAQNPVTISPEVLRAIVSWSGKAVGKP